MAMVLAAIGFLMCAGGLYGAARPLSFATMMRAMNAQRLSYLAIGLRALLGTVCVLAAADTRYPNLISVIGYIAFVAAFVLALAGHDRVQSLILWWLDRLEPFLRVGFVVVVFLGAFLIHAAF